MTTGMNNTIWWGIFEIVPEASVRWEIGPLRFSVRHKAQEWQVCQTNDGQAESDEISCHITPGESLEAEGATPERYLFTRTQDTLQVSPCLADRPVIVRPANPFRVQPGQEATIFVSSPLWVRLEVHEPRNKLGEFPIQRPSDTWFGPSTLEGELCYASRTQGRLSLEELPQRPHRAVTPVTIRNLGAEALLLERLSLPVPFLSLYSTDEGNLWTEGVTMVREADTDIAGITIAEHVPPQAAATHRVAEPRKKAEKNMLMRAFGALLR
jgi:hypothetical protein